jgi:hypothetical protein
MALRASEGSDARDEAPPHKPTIIATTSTNRPIIPLAVVVGSQEFNGSFVALAFRGIEKLSEL